MRLPFTTQYQLQLDLINGLNYTRQDIEELINQRRLLTPSVYKRPYEMTITSTY